MSDNGRIDSSALYRLSYMANIGAAYSRLISIIWEGLKYGEEPDLDVVLLALRHLYKETEKAGVRVKKMKDGLS